MADSSGRAVSVAALILSVVSITVVGLVGGAQVVAQTAAVQSQVCVTWAQYVAEQQQDPRWADVDPALVDRRIDRAGAVLYSRLAESFASDESGLGSSPSADPSAGGAPAVVPTVSLAEYCGSAAEFRLALQTDERQAFDKPR
jgi:hypothetical protein